MRIPLAIACWLSAAALAAADPGAHDSVPPVSEPVAEAPPIELPPLDPNLAREDEIAFERARVEALRARVKVLREALEERAQARAASVAPETSAAPHHQARAPQPSPAPPPAHHAPEPKHAPAPQPRHEPNEPKTKHAPAAEDVVPEPTHAPDAPARSPADELMLARALVRSGKLEQALAAFSSASSAAEKARQDELFAAARYGQARVLERLGRTEEAIGAYQVVEQLKTGGSWRKLAGFGLRFARWRLKVSNLSARTQTK